MSHSGKFRFTGTKCNCKWNVQTKVKIWRPLVIDLSLTDVRLGYFTRRFSDLEFCVLQAWLWKEKKRDPCESLCNAHWGRGRAWARHQLRYVCVAQVHCLAHVLIGIVCMLRCRLHVCLCVWNYCGGGLCVCEWPAFVHVLECVYLITYVHLCLCALREKKLWPLCSCVHVCMCMLSFFTDYCCILRWSKRGRRE